MSPVFITSIVGAAIAIMALGQVGPSLIATRYVQAIDNNIGREESLVQQILLYRQNEGSYPSTVADLVSKGYWRSSDASNGLGGTYSFAADESKGVLVITSQISDAGARNMYASSPRHAFRPTINGDGSVSTTYVMPSQGSVGSNILFSQKIIASASAPDAATNKYWYDTSSGKAVLKVSNGSAWLAAGSVSANSAAGFDTSKVVSSPNELPTSGTDGDVRYVFNAASGTLDTVVYYAGGWRQQAVGSALGASSNPITVDLAPQTLPLGFVGKQFSFDFKPLVSARYISNLAAAPIDSQGVYWSAPGGLPPGLSLNKSTGVLTGVPTTKTARPSSGAGFNILATFGASGQQSYSLQVGPPIAEAINVDHNGFYTCAIGVTGNLMCWGINGSGQLGVGNTNNQPSATQVGSLLSGITKVATSFTSACALTTSGSVKCWGANNVGQLGNGSTTPSTVPVDVSGLSSGVTDIQASAQTETKCALMQTGKVRCWGPGGYLGNNSSAGSNVPVEVSNLSNATKLSLGSSSACAVTASGTVFCWGANGNGQLGNGTQTNQMSAVQVSNIPSGASDVDVGTNHACAIVSGGARCWGSHGSGGVGHGPAAPITAVTTPAQVVGLTSGVSQIKVSDNSNFACALLSSGGLKCWGQNTTGQIGDGTLATRTSPVDVTGMTSGVANFSVGRVHACGVTTSGVVKCWGSNANGELGNNSVGGTSANVTAQGLPKPAASIHVGYAGGVGGANSTCAILTDSSVYCWGNNASFRLGTYDRENINVPTPLAVTKENW